MSEFIDFLSQLGQFLWILISSAVQMPIVCINEWLQRGRREFVPTFGLGREILIRTGARVAERLPVLSARWLYPPMILKIVTELLHPGAHRLYKTWKHKTEPDFQGLWITEPNRQDFKDEIVLLYFHGSGYHIMNPYVQLPFVLTLYKELIKEMSTLSVFMPEYSLAPEFPFPAQLWEAERAYRYLVEEKGIPHDKIILAGDSAGGHMVISLLEHLVKPYPHLKRPGSTVEPKILASTLGLPRSAVAISPWTKNHGTTIPADPRHSYNRNNGRDMLNPSLIAKWGESFAQTTTLEDPYLSPCLAPPSWLKPFPPLLLLASECELLYDDIVEFYHHCKQAGAKHVLLHSVADSIHDWPLVDWMMFLSPSRRYRGVKSITKFIQSSH